MTRELWSTFSTMEQLSNIHGEVVRLVRARKNYILGKTDKDYSGQYLEKIHRLIGLTLEDPKNARRDAELYDEEGEIKRYLNDEVDDNYILRYWEQFTKAIS